jgi:hypothetical protein
MVNKWCVCGDDGYLRWGKIIRVYGKTVDILYSSTQRYPAEPWDINYVTICNNLVEAVMKVYDSDEQCHSHPWPLRKHMWLADLQWSGEIPDEVEKQDY